MTERREREAKRGPKDRRVRYQSAAAAARQLGVTPRRVRVLCAEGRVPGAERVGWAWLLPDPVRVTEARKGPKRRTVSEAPGRMPS